MRSFLFVGFLAACEAASSHYGRPPCLSDEVKVVVSDGYEVCTSVCTGDASSCPDDLPGDSKGFSGKGAQCGIVGSKFSGRCYVPCELDSDCDIAGGAYCVARHPLGACAYPVSGPTTTTTATTVTTTTTTTTTSTSVFPPIEWPKGQPSDYGWVSEDLLAANAIIDKHILTRQCTLLARDGKLIWEHYQNNGNMDYVFDGYSMTKSVGAFLVLMAATLGELDLDAGITVAYGISSPKEYEVTSRMILAQVLSSPDAPGKTWEYDSLGSKWLYKLPLVLKSATGKSATDWFALMKARLEMPNFQWDTVEKEWYTGAKGTCRDWARIGSVLANGGKWKNDQVISTELMVAVAAPVKYEPFNYYSNTCWGLGFWINSDKSVYPGCCWEASRLPAPMCNNETFINGAEHGLVMMLGLYGQVVLAIPSRKTAILSMGSDIRPIEPVRLGVYPGFHNLLDLPQSEIPEIPKPRCGEPLECLGITAQCYAGLPSDDEFNHSHPEPGRHGCQKCVRERVTLWAKNPLAEPILKEHCKLGGERSEDWQLADYAECFCFDGDAPFPWPSTTTTTPAPSDAPFPPKLYTTTTRPSPPTCNVPPKCFNAMVQYCHPYTGGTKCQECFRTFIKRHASANDCGSLIGTQFLDGVITNCFCGIATLFEAAEAPAIIVGIENHYHEQVTLADYRDTSLFSVAASSTIDLDGLHMDTTLGVTQPLHISAASGPLVAVWHNWSHRGLYAQAPPYSAKVFDCRHRYDDRSGFKPLGAKLQGRPECKDAECCRAACCYLNFQAEYCYDWSYGPQGCVIGKADSWERASGWSGGSEGYIPGGIPAPAGWLAHTGSPFDGYYTIVVSEIGAVSIRNEFYAAPASPHCQDCFCRKVKNDGWTSCILRPWSTAPARFQKFHKCKCNSKKLYVGEVCPGESSMEQSLVVL